MIGRGMLLFGFAVWTWSLLTAPMTAALDSFMHLVNLPFHEAGHIIFSPFGRFMTAVGGSLGQLLVPGVCAVALLVQTQDPFGASLCVWWLGESLLDLAPYIDDARSLQMPLLGGQTGAEVEGHDWEAILGSAGWLHLDHTLAGAARGAGGFLMIGGLVCAAAVLTKRGLFRPRTSEKGGRPPSTS